MAQAVPGIRQEPARAARSTFREEAGRILHPERRTTWPDGRCRSRWAFGSSASIRVRAPLMSRVDRVTSPPRGRSDTEAGLLPGGCARRGRGHRGQPLLAAGLNVEWTSGMVSRTAPRTGRHAHRAARPRGQASRGAPRARAWDAVCSVARAASAVGRSTREGRLYRPWNTPSTRADALAARAVTSSPSRRCATSEARAGISARPSTSSCCRAFRRSAHRRQPIRLPARRVHWRLGPAGVAALKDFVQAGGTLVCLRQLGPARHRRPLPAVKKRRRGLPAEQFFCPAR